MKKCSLEERSEPSGKRGFHPCFCLPACRNRPVALLDFITLFLTILLYLNRTVSNDAIATDKTNCKANRDIFESQMWATRPHLGSIFKKLLHRKTFILPAACFLFYHSLLSLYPFSHKIHTKFVALLSNLFYNKQKEVTHL